MSQNTKETAQDVRGNWACMLLLIMEHEN
jgi:hypothetical protein